MTTEAGGADGVVHGPAQNSTPAALHQGNFSRPARPRAWRDALVVLGTTTIALALCIRLDVSEALRRLTAPWERLQLDELPPVLLVLAAGLAWFAARRYLEAGQELARRRGAEQRLAAVLAENRRLAQQYLMGQEAERKALARELHDELGQSLQLIQLDAVGLHAEAGAAAPGLRARAAAILETCAQLHRVLAQLIRALRPVGLDELGLAAALEHCVDTWRARLPHARLGIAVEGDLTALPEAIALTVYRLVQEGLTNAAKHASPRRVDIGIGIAAPTGPQPAAILVAVTDDGCGVDPAAPTAGLGLVGLRERVVALAGTLEIASAPGRGFALRARLPLTAAAALAPQGSES